MLLRKLLRRCTRGDGFLVYLNGGYFLNDSRVSAYDLHKGRILCELSGYQLLICIRREYFVSLVAISY